MPNPFKVKFGLKCEGCSTRIEKDDAAFFDSDKKFCLTCAEKRQLVCKCGNYKKGNFLSCYECNQKYEKLPPMDLS